MFRRVLSFAGTLALMLCASAQAQSGSYWIDIDSTQIDGTNSGGPIDTEPGWTSLNGTAGNASPGVTIDGISFTIGSADGSRIRLDGGVGDPNALTGDFVYDDGPGEAVILYFGGAGSLPAGPWQVEMWAWDETSPFGYQFAALRTNNAETIMTDSAVADPVNPAATFSFESDGTSAYDVFFRENNSQNRARLNAVRLTRISATDVILDPGGVSPGALPNDNLGTLIPVSTWSSASYSYTLVAGDGDTNNAEFAIVGDQLRTSANWPNTHTIGEVLSVRVRIEDADFGQFEGALLIPVINDSDDDGLDDDWERLYFANDLTAATAEGNNDSDLLTNAEEYIRGTAPNDEDSDNDNLNDDVENNSGVFVSATDTGTDPNNDDTDGDDVKDGDELDDGSNPLIADADNDGLNDGAEKAQMTDPGNPDTDGDGIHDGSEVTNTTNPLDPADPAAFTMLAAYWPLDTATADQNPDTTPDMSPNGYDLELSNMTAANFVMEDGRMAASFNGSDTMLVRIHNSGDDLPAHQHDGCTVSLWIKANGTGQSDRRFFSEGSTTDEVPLFNLGTHNSGADGRINSYIRDTTVPNPASAVFSVAAPLDGLAWRHVVFTTNNNTQQHALYVDGVLDKDNYPYRDLRNLGLDTTTVGGILRSDFSHWISGFVDDVAVWKRVLTADEISELQTGTSPLQLGKPSSFIITSVTRNPNTNEVTLIWNSESGKNYKILFSTDLQGDPRTWGDLKESHPSGGTQTTYIDTVDPASVAQRFYVIEELP